MERFIKKHMISALVIPIAFCMSGCSFFPKEEIADPIILMEEQEAKEYETVAVKRGSKTAQEEVTCVMKSVKTEDLSFGVSGLRYGSIYVSTGSHVKKGDLLATLELDDLEEKQDGFEADKSVKEEEINHTEKILEIKKKKAVYAEDEETRKECQSEIEEAEKSIESLQKELDIIDEQVDQVNEAMELRSIYASMDGVITYALEVTEYDSSLAKEKFFTISDEDIIFKSVTGVDSNVHTGQAVTMEIDKIPYDAEIVNISQENAGTIISLEVEGATDFEEGTIGTINFDAESFQDSLYLASSIIFEVGGEPAVYTLDEYGLKQICKIETGITAGKYTQILSGLKEGDQVVSE